MPVQAILTALTSGKMQAIGAGLSAAERAAVASYLGVAGVESIPQSAHCSSNPPLSKSTRRVGTAGESTRPIAAYQNAKAAGLTAADVPKLKLKWAFGYPGVTTSFGTPTVFGGRIFVGAADGSVFSLNAQSGCIHWIYQSDGRRPHRPHYFERRKDRVSQRSACVGARRQRRNGSGDLEDPR